MKYPYIRIRFVELNREVRQDAIPQRSLRKRGRGLMLNGSSLVNSSLSRTGFTKRSGEDGAPSARLSEKSDFKSWGFKMSNVPNEEQPYVEQIVDLEQEMKSK
jgi:hypothetical protein